MRRLLSLVWLVGLSLVLTHSQMALPGPADIRHYTWDSEFDYLSWVVDAAALKLQQGALGPERFLSEEAQSEYVRACMALVQRILDAENDLRRVRDAIEEVTHPSLDPNSTKVLILDLYPVNRVDSSALHVLTKLHETLRSRGVALYLSGVKGPVRDAMKAAGLAEKIGPDHFFDRIFEASESAKRYLNGYLAS